MQAQSSPNGTLFAGGNESPMDIERQIGRLSLGFSNLRFDRKDQNLINKIKNLDIKDNLEDVSLKIGYQLFRQEYSNKDLFISPIATVGLSKKELTSFYSDPTKSLLKLAVGIKVELYLDKNHNNDIIKKDLNPFLEIAHQKYGRTESGYGGILGLSVGF